MSDALKTVFKYDAGARGFKRASLVLFFLAGLLLAFTPCVFPMIPILTGLIVIY